MHDRDHYHYNNRHDLDMNIVTNLFREGITDFITENAMRESIFYICGGQDSSPVIAFGSKYPLYVYTDIINYEYGYPSFDECIGEMYAIIKHHGFDLLNQLRTTHTPKVAWRRRRQTIGPDIEIDITEWVDKQTRETFFIAYVRDDSLHAYKEFYRPDDDNFFIEDYTHNIIPRCLYNQRWEFSTYEDSKLSILYYLEEHTDYIFWENHCKDLEQVGEYDYYTLFGVEDKNPETYVPVEKVGYYKRKR